MKKTLNVYVAIGIGGMIGATSRYSLSLFIGFQGVFPIATLIINMVGCFLLSYLLNANVLKRYLSSTLLTAISTGIIGSFTTFSTVTIETMDLINSNIGLATLYIVLTVFGGLVFCFAGYKFANRNMVKQ